jgi:predicted nucleic acid-binding protein
MSDRAFLDINVFVYAIVQDDPRSHDAEKLISAGGRVSVQVLNEFAAVVRRKTNMP